MIDFRRKVQAIKCSSHHTINLITHRAKIVMRRKLRMYLGKASLDLEEERNWDAENNIRTSFGHRWGIVCLHLIMKTGPNWWKSWRKLLLSDMKEDWSTNCTWIRVLKYDWTKRRQEVWRLEKELDKDAVCHRFYTVWAVSTLPRKLLKGLDSSE